MTAELAWDIEGDHYVVPYALRNLTPAWDRNGAICNFCATEVFSAHMYEDMTAFWRRENTMRILEKDHERRAHEVLRSSIQDCPFCGRIIAVLNGVVRLNESIGGAERENALVTLLETSIRVLLRFELSFKHNCQVGSLLLTVSLDARDDPELCEALSHTGVDTGSVKDVYRVHFAFHTGPARYEAQIFPQLHGKINMASEECFEGIQNFMNMCDRKDDSPVANLGELGELPTRAIDVEAGPPQVVNFDELGTNQAQPYMALSYCWGGRQEYTLSACMLEHMPFTLEEERIPKTIRDAIRVAQRLQIRYLWVDALCIAQDDEDDKSHEILKMHSIYRNARLTLVSALTHSAHEGFLRCSTPKLAEPFHLTPFEIANAEDTLVLEPYPSMLEDLPSHRRAWTLQEHLMSSHLLVFASDGVFISCRHTDSCVEDNDSTMHVNTRMFPQPDTDARSIWYNIVDSYSRREMSHASDKLVAISALARQLAKKTGERYFAGIWEYQMPSALVWQVVSDQRTREDLYRAPSWSWASREGAIEFRMGRAVYRDCRVLDCFVEPLVHGDAFGPVKDGYLVLRAAYCADISGLTTDQRDYIWLHQSLDLPYDSQADMVYVAINELYERETFPDGGISGLVLQVVDQEFSQSTRKKYRRIGCFYYYPVEMFEDGEIGEFYVI